MNQNLKNARKIANTQGNKHLHPCYPCIYIYFGKLFLELVLFLRAGAHLSKHYTKHAASARPANYQFRLNAYKFIFY